jgi:hypothetical protein
MHENNLYKAPNNLKTSDLTEDKLRQWAIHRGYKKPTIYVSKKLMVIIDTETVFWGFATTDETIEAKITKILNLANQIADLPSDVLESIAYTDDLKEEFNRHRNDSLKISKYFILKIFKIEEIEEDALDKKNSKQWAERILAQSGYRYRALFELITVGFKDIKKAFPDLRLTKPEQLVFEIIRDERDYFFEKIATSDFIQILTDTLTDFYQGVVAGECYEELEKRCIAKGLGTVHKGEWLHKCLELLEEKAIENHKNRGRLRAYYTESDTLAETIAASCEVRDSKGKIKKSIQWRLGQALIFDNRNRPTIPLLGLQNLMKSHKIGFRGFWAYPYFRELNFNRMYTSITLNQKKPG